MTPSNDIPITVETTSLETSIALFGAGYRKPRIDYYWAVKPDSDLSVKLSGLNERLAAFSLEEKWKIYPAWQFGELVAQVPSGLYLALTDSAYALLGAFGTAKAPVDHPINAVDALGKLLVIARYQGVLIPGESQTTEHV